MPIFSVLFFRAVGVWRGEVVDLAGTESIDDIADLMRDVAAARDVEAVDGTMVLMMEADDEWFGVIRVDDHADPRVFLSDVRVVGEYPIAALLLDSGDVHAPQQREGTGQQPYPDPGGDEELLADLGTSGKALRSMAVAEGALPGDVLADLADRAGFGDVLDMLHS
ncbi:putative tRNA adenosine deaminase-associated protein [Nocardiopsis mwathae]|uniref:Putative tRNA adenosine deaminase-associated protein n=1 Tax=Nocardiopsis mwathae TaxID=1472723 RepID=A0A7W9YLW6_9ACTN|nr:putative tRNA adenosine deaminase-associated protein [Nocardiopsis mwathae]